MLVFLNILCWLFAILNGIILATGYGGPLNVIALVTCVASGMYGLAVMSR